MPWLLKQKKKAKKKSKKQKKRYKFSTKKYCKIEIMKYGEKSPSTAAGEGSSGKQMFITMWEWMWTLYSTIVALFSPFIFLLFIFRWPWKCWNLFAVCMSLHEPCLCVCERFKKGRWGSVTLVLKVKVYFRGRSCTWISLTLHRGGRTGGRKIWHKWLEFWQWHCGEMHWEKSTTVFTVKLSTRHLSFQRNLYIYV